MTASKVNPIPEGMHTVTPHLVCAGASDAIGFYKQAFGAEEISRMPDAKGKVMHAEIRIGNSVIMLVDEYPEWGSVGPKTLNGTPVTIHLYVPNVDEIFERAIAAGATARMPVQDMFWGDRYGVLEDPFGHKWGIATHMKDLTPEEIQKAAQEAMG